MSAAKHREVPEENLLKSEGDLRVHRTQTQQPRQHKTSLSVPEWSSQRPDLNPSDHLRRDLKTIVQTLPCSLTDFERICQEHFDKLPKSRCEKHVIFSKFVKMFPLCHYGLEY